MGIETILHSQLLCCHSHTCFLVIRKSHVLSKMSVNNASTGCLWTHGWSSHGTLIADSNNVDLFICMVPFTSVKDVVITL